MPMRMNLFAERPEESEVEGYLLTDNEKETIYAYWKVLYEKVTEESLYADYVIQNVSLSMKGRSKKFSAASAYSFGNNQERLRKNASHAKPGKSLKAINSVTAMHPGEDIRVLPPHVRKEEVKHGKRVDSSTSYGQGHGGIKKIDLFSYDEMDLLGPSYKKTTQRARKISNADEGSIQAKKILYAPIGICIKTTSPHTTKAKDLLQSIIAVLAKNEETYSTAIHSIIFSYAEFCSHVLSLTQLTTPPPFTELVIPMPDTEIVYYQGLLSNVPCESDVSIVNLFLLLPTEYVITLWTGLVLEKNVLVYTSKPNVYFHIAKALIHLIFPLGWHFLKGIVPNLSLLSPPLAYCFGILKSTSASRLEIVKTLSEEDVSYLMVDVDYDREAVLDFGLKEALVYPNSHRLKKELDACCEKFGVCPKKSFSDKDDWHEAFARQVQDIFLNEVMQLLDGFEHALKKDRGRTFATFMEEFMRYKRSLKDTPGFVADMKFFEEMASKQAFATLRDEAIHSKQGNYARMEAMNVQGKSPPIELLRISLYSTPNIVLNRLFRLVELKAAQENSKKDNSTPIPLRKKFDWVKEIMKMKTSGTIVEKPEESPSMLNPSNFSNNSSDLCREKQTIMGDTRDYSMYGSYLVPSTDSVVKNKRLSFNLAGVQESARKGQKRVHFYGAKGVLAFLDEFMRLDSEQVWKTGIIEEERNVLEYYRKHRVVNNTSDAVPVYTNAEEPDDQLDLSPASKSSMIELKNSFKLNLSLIHETPFLNFSNSRCLQFQLFLGIFCYKHDPVPMHAVNAFLKAFSYIQGSATYTSYFPIKFFKLLLNKLSVEELRKLLQVPNEVASVIRAAYEDKIKEAIALKRRATTDSKAIGKLLHEDKMLKRQSAKMPSFLFRSGMVEECKGYLNDGHKTSKLFDSNPNTVMLCLLSDMLTLLNLTKSKGQKMFAHTLKLPLFKVIERQASSLRVLLVFILETEFLYEGREQVLAKERGGAAIFLFEPSQLHCALRAVQDAASQIPQVGQGLV